MYLPLVSQLALYDRKKIMLSVYVGSLFLAFMMMSTCGESFNTKFTVLIQINCNLETSLISKKFQDCALLMISHVQLLKLINNKA